MPTRTCLSDLHLNIHTRFDTLAAPVAVARLAERAGFSNRAIKELEIAASELATNLMHHAGGGTLIACFGTEPRIGIALVSEDSGPGFEDIERALEDGFSAGYRLKAIAPSERAGLGSGLGAVNRFMDSMTVENRPDGGALIIAFKSLS